MVITQVVMPVKVLEKIEHKHSVMLPEVEDVLKGHHKIRKLQRGHVRGEDLYVALGRSRGGRYLAVFLIYKGQGRCVIISAREMDDSERRFYEKA